DLAPGAIKAGNLDPSAIGAPGFAKVLSNGNTFLSRGITSVAHTNGTGKYCITTSFAPHVAVATADAGLGFGTTAQVQIPGGFGGAGCDPDEIAVTTGTTSPAAVADEVFYIVIE